MMTSSEDCVLCADNRLLEDQEELSHRSQVTTRMTRSSSTSAGSHQGQGCCLSAACLTFYHVIRREEVGDMLLILFRTWTRTGSLNAKACLALLATENSRGLGSNWKKSF